ncbi:MAG: O-antigen ligase family protein [Bacteroidales bacterium]|nr:O-antigen ligase family protein [Candidatus Latescibacterota bacterium]
MRFEIFGEPVHKVRLALALFVLTVFAAAVIILMPRGLVRLAFVGIFTLPILILFFDHPEWTLYVLLGLLFSNIFIFFHFPLVRMAALFLISSWGLSVLMGRRIVIHDRRMFFLTTAFLILSFQSMIFARNIASSINRMDNFLTTLVTLFLIIQFSRSRNEFFKVLFVISLGCLVSNFLPFLVPPPEKYADLSLIWGQAVLRYEGYLREPNMFAFSLTFLIPILFILFARLKRPWFARPVVAVATVGTIFVMALSFSRGAFVALAAMFLTLLIVERRNRSILFAGLAMIVAGALLAPAAYWERIASLVEIGNSMTEDTAIISRIYTMKIALILGIRNPLFGVGLENFLFHASRFTSFGNFVHNSILQVFSDLGIPALIVYFWIMIYNLRVTRGLMNLGGDPEAAQIGRLLFVQQVGVLINSMFIPVSHHMILWLTMLLPTMAWYACTGRQFTPLKKSLHQRN